MTQKIAVAVIHGVGEQQPGYAKTFADTLVAMCRLVCGDDIVVKPVLWAPVFDQRETDLWCKMQAGGSMWFGDARQFIVSYAGDAIAYQIAPHDRKNYDDVHLRVAQTLKQLAAEAGPKAPLCVIAHSLGSVIASNYVYDLQNDPGRPEERRLILGPVRECIGDTPLEQGKTLSLFYTLGSPLALWGLRYENFGAPIAFPAPELGVYYPGLQGEWINFYSKTDVIASPLKKLSEAYQKVVNADKAVWVGNALQSWNPLSHMGYWTGQVVLETITEGLIRVWKAINT